MHGNARFVDGNTLEVEGPNGGRERLRGSAFVIASGARPYHPADVDFSHPRVRDSDTLLKLDFTPSSVTIYGAGVIGCEYASMLRVLGMKVMLVDARDKLLSSLDDEIVDALALTTSATRAASSGTTRSTSASRPTTTASCCT